VSKKKKNSEIRESRKTAILGTVIGWIMKLWSATLRYEFEDRCGICTPGNFSGPVIFALWHNRIFTIPPIWHKTGGKGRKTAVLTSASHDGTTLAKAMDVFHLGAVRGSSSRRAVAALLGMKRTLRDGVDICITPDGPRGPRYIFHPGVIKLAESSGSPIIPIHARYSSAWRLKTWDRFVLPKPLSKVHVTFGEALHISRIADDAAFETERVRIEQILRDGADDV